MSSKSVSKLGGDKEEKGKPFKRPSRFRDPSKVLTMASARGRTGSKSRREREEREAEVRRDTEARFGRNRWFEPETEDSETGPDPG